MVAAAARACELAVVIRRCEGFDALVKHKKDRDFGGATVKDFVSVADLLIQRLVQRDLSESVAGLGRGRVLGEEDGGFRDHGTGEDVKLDPFPSDERELRAALTRILPPGSCEVEQVCAVILRPLEKLAPGLFDDAGVVGECDVDDVAIWVDPLDSTASYVKGVVPERSGTVSAESGALPTTTVIVGAFSVSSGAPLCGVVGQPFSSLDRAGWQSRVYWGWAGGRSDGRGHGVWPAPNEADETLGEGDVAVAVSKNESALMTSAIGKGVGPIVAAAGAGFKLLLVVRKLASAYFVGMPTTYSWDTCGAHAIIVALGGEVVDAATGEPLRYAIGNRQPHPNGLVASLSHDTISRLLAATRGAVARAAAAQ